MGESVQPVTRLLTLPSYLRFVRKGLLPYADFIG